MQFLKKFTGPIPRSLRSRGHFWGCREVFFKNFCIFEFQGRLTSVTSATSGIFFSKTTFLKSVHSKEKDKTFSSKFSLSLSKEEMWWCLIWTVSNKLLKSYECTLELYIFYFLWDKNLKNIPQMFCFSQKCTSIYILRRTKACCSGFGKKA